MILFVSVISIEKKFEVSVVSIRPTHCVSIEKLCSQLTNPLNLFVLFILNAMHDRNMNIKCQIF